MKDNEKNNLHKNHRERLRNKFKLSPETITNHELVEMLLYYTIPRADTNEAAHELLNLAKNRIENVFELDKMQIKSVGGLGENSADFIFLLAEILKRIEKEKISAVKVKRLTTQNIKNYLLGEFLGAKKEQFIMISTDIDCNFLNKHILSVGSETASVVSVKEIVRNAISDRAAFVFIAHNHPNGVLVPSGNDIEITKAVCEALALVEISVIEHYIVTKKDCLGIIKSCDLFKN